MIAFGWEVFHREWGLTWFGEQQFPSLRYGMEMQKGSEGSGFIPTLRDKAAKDGAPGQGANRRSFDCASRGKAARGSAQDDNSYIGQSLTLGLLYADTA